MIQTPSAFSRPEGSVSLILNKNDIWKFGTLSVSPFNWLEASYFYYRPSDLLWGTASKKGQYLDKGFNVKLIYRPKNGYIPNIALGMDDFAGTGYFSREYIVGSKELNNTTFSMGMGWGKFTGEKSFKNPLSYISDEFINRPSALENNGFAGNLSKDKWFRGDVSFFGGFEYSIPKSKGIKLKVEYDPFDYFDFSATNRTDVNYDIRKKDAKINIGVSIPINKYLTIDTSYIKGNTFNISFSMGLAFDNSLSNKSEFNPKIIKANKGTKNKKTFYKDLLANLNNNKLYLQTANLDDSGNLDISISATNHRNAIRSSSYSGYISKKVADLNEINLTTINVSHINAGIQLNNISYIPNYFDEDDSSPFEVIIRNTKLDSSIAGQYKDNEFKPSVPFPLYFSAFNPRVISHVGYPSQFYAGGLDLQYLGELQFSRNLLFTFEVNQRLFGNLEEKTISRPDSQLQNVRSGVVNYIKEDDIRIGRAQLDYIWSPRKNVFAKVSGGLFESSFGGFGAEILYKPFDKKFSIGMELFEVKQRSYKQRFEFKDYKTSTGHISLGYKLPAGIQANLSFGRYLAKDDGYTLDLGRRTESGFKAGIYFTRTNIPAAVFGEGSFDKGFYFQFPLDLFSNNYRGDYSTFKYAPITRDGGARLIYDKSLRGLIYNSTYSELNNQWNGFVN